jgi:hypothetical protein
MIASEKAAQQHAWPSSFVVDAGQPLAPQKAPPTVTVTRIARMTRPPVAPLSSGSG